MAEPSFIAPCTTHYFHFCRPETSYRLDLLAVGCAALRMRIGWTTWSRPLVRQWAGWPRLGEVMTCSTCARDGCAGMKPATCQWLYRFVIYLYSKYRCNMV